MKVTSLLIILSALLAIFATIAAATGLFLKDEGAPFTFYTLCQFRGAWFGRRLVVASDPQGPGQAPLT